VDLSRGRNRIPAVDFENAPGGEGSSHAIDPTNPDIVYSAGFYGTISRTDLATGERKSIVPKAPKGEQPYRGQWVAPFIISPHNPYIIYHGMNYLFRSLDRGDTWERISPDLTFNNPDQLGDIPYQTLFTISESPLKFGLIYAGTDDGRAWVTRDGGINWKEINTRLPRKWISRLSASAFDEGTVYMSCNGKRDDDFAAYLYKSPDYGETWQDISGNIPCGPINVIREDPKNSNVLYVGTDIGAYVSVDKGKNWHVLANNLPSTFVHDMVIQPKEDILVAATHGRGIYAMDVRYIQKLTPATLEKPAVLYELEPVHLPNRWMRRWSGGRIPGAEIGYFLTSDQEIQLTVWNAEGTVIKTLAANGTVGLHFVNWDLSSEKADTVKPGTYTIRLSTPTGDLEQSLEVRPATRLRY
jgi:hypothetical protein